jgi:hypothetical protein
MCVGVKDNLDYKPYKVGRKFSVMLTTKLKGTTNILFIPSFTKVGETVSTYAVLMPLRESGKRQPYNTAQILSRYPED